MVVAAKASSKVTRISMSLPEDLLNELDEVVKARRAASRSAALGDMIHGHMVEHKRQTSDAIMTGTITLLYNNSVAGLQKALADLQYRHIDEVISSLHVHLMHDQTMEVLLVQGPARTLQTILDEMTSRRGVVSGRMTLMAALIPPIHPFEKKSRKPPQTAKQTARRPR